MAQFHQIWIWMSVWYILIVSTGVFWNFQGVESHRLHRHKHGDYFRGVSEKYKYLHEIPMDYQEAKEACEKEGQNLPFTSSINEYSEFTSFLGKRKNFTVWLSVKRKIFTQWMWVYESHYKEFPPVSEKMECGFIDYTAANLRKTKCAALWLGYICQAQTTACETFRAGAKQLKVGTKCFRVSFEKVNWYEARWRCQREDMDLAVIESQDEERQLKNVLGEIWSIFKLYQFWIGFYNADWFLHDGIKESITNHSVFWDWGEPSNRGPCAVVERENHLWRSADCSERHHVVCQAKPKATTELHLTKPTTNPALPAKAARDEGQHCGNQVTRLEPDSSTV